MPARCDILIPTCDRARSLVMTLAGVAAQDFTDLRLIVADQSGETLEEAAVIAALRRIIRARGGEVEWHHRPRRRGIAEQRQFLLDRSTAPTVLYVDDDVFMEPGVVGRLVQVLETESCGFVGAFPAGLSFKDDIRPEQQRIEYWDGPVTPEVVEPGSAEWQRYHLHRAANLHHVAATLPDGEYRLYRVAWIACCVAYDRAKLLEVGGFGFWPRLPRYHSGEEVLVQNLLLRKWGGCGIIPSATYHSELPSTVLNDDGRVDGHALALLPEMTARLGVTAERLTGLGQ